MGRIDSAIGFYRIFLDPCFHLRDVSLEYREALGELLAFGRPLDVQLLVDGADKGVCEGNVVGAGADKSELVQAA